VPTTRSLLSQIRGSPLITIPDVALITIFGVRQHGAAEVRALVLSLFGLFVTIGLATYNYRNDQLYDALVGRAASIERQLGLSDGSFANRPRAWLVVRVSKLSWGINHRAPVALIYSASIGLWIFSACAAGVQLGWGHEAAPRGFLAAAIVPAIAVPIVAALILKRQRDERKKGMRADALAATEWVHGKDLRRVLDNPDLDSFLKTCSQLSGVKLADARARARFYTKLPPDERRKFMPSKPDDLIAAHFVALISDLSAEWIYDCFTQRRKQILDEPEPRDDGPRETNAQTAAEAAVT
jgi:hypothetical protein